MDMAITINKQKVVSQLFTALAKHGKGETPERPVLEQFIYAVLREGSTREHADQAFANLQNRFFDWNEVRVTTVKELSELMQGLPDPAAAAANLKHILHSVFETHYEFNLESLRKQNLGVAIKNLEKLRGTTPFSISYVVQHALGGHSIPLCKGSLDVMLIISAISLNS